MANTPPFSGPGNDLTLPITPADYVNEIQDNFAKCKDEILGLDTRISAITNPPGLLTLNRRVIIATSGLAITTDGVILVDSTAGAVNVTLPLATTAPPDGKFRVFYIQHVAGNNTVQVVPAPPDVFPNSLTKVVLSNVRKGGMYVGVWNDGAGSAKWVYGPPLENFIHVRRAAALAVGSWVALTPLVFDTLLHNLNTAAFTFVPSSAIITSVVRQDVAISASLVVEFTSGSHTAIWTAQMQVYVNGSPVVGTLRTIGGRGNVFGELDLPVVSLRLAAGDTVEIRIINTGGLTGNLVSASLHMRSFI